MELTTTELTARIYYGSPGFRLIEPREQVAVRRALAGLARSELVIRLGAMHHRSRDCHWSGARCARKSLSVARLGGCKRVEADVSLSSPQWPPMLRLSTCGASSASCRPPHAPSTTRWSPRQAPPPPWCAPCWSAARRWRRASPTFAPA